jgi:hypothetical protein
LKLSKGWSAYIFPKNNLRYPYILIIHLICTIMCNVVKKPLIVGLAIFLCASFEFEFNLSEKVKAKICMEGRMIMIMMIACIKMVVVGVCGVCPAKSI